MDRFIERQQEIDRRAEEVIACYPMRWSQTIEYWRQPSLEDQAWLMYFANCLFCAGNGRWAIDPLRLKQRLPERPFLPGQ